MLTFYISPTFYRLVPRSLILGGANLTYFLYFTYFYRFIPRSLTLGGAYLAYFLYFTYFLPLCSSFASSRRCQSRLLSIFHLLFTALFLVRLFQAVPILLTFYISPTFYRFVPHSLTLGGANLTYFLYFTYFLPLCSSFAHSRRCQSCLLSIFHLLFTALFLIHLL